MINARKVGNTFIEASEEEKIKVRKLQTLDKARGKVFKAMVDLIGPNIWPW